jgi:hypothetical protein
MNWVLCCFAAFCWAKAGAQVYAPDTEFHDKAQRLFAVETARVLAWRENLNGQSICEVAYKVSVDTNRVTTWKLNWLDKDGKPIRQIRVSYPEALLSEGPRFYREVFKQIWSQGKCAALPNLTATELNERYWQGSELNGMAREEGLQAAFKLAGAKPSSPEVQYAPALAGLLAHIPLPSLCGGLTLDAELLARGAAWLALSESMLKEPASASDESWAPILFMAGREIAGCKLWRDKIKPNEKSIGAHALTQWWDFFLRRPTARAAYEFITDPRQRRFGMPMMTYYSRLEYLGTPLVEVLPALYGTERETFTKLYNYGGFLSASTDVGGGRLLEGAWPAIFREEWRKTLTALPASPLDYNGYVEKLKAVKASDPLTPSAKEDLSLVGLKEIAPVLQLGYEQGKGKLIPVATVTARDLLNYGWEMNALQMGARYYFVKKVWGVPDLAETIFREATRDIEGQAPFFPDSPLGNAFNLLESYNRVQMVDDLGWRRSAENQPFAKDVRDAAGARTFYKRCWLRPYEVRMEGYALGRSGLTDDMIQVLKRYHAECGAKSDVITVEYLRDWDDKEIDQIPGLRELKEQIAETFIDPTGLQVKALYRKLYRSMPNDVRAKAYEQIFWRNPDSNLEQDILNGYIVGVAWKSAKRFYTQAREVVSREVGFSNWLAPKAWVLGFLQGDEALMDLALEDSNSGSQLAMITVIWHYLAHDQVEKMEAQIDQLIERYEPNAGPQSPGRMLKGFVPLLPALKDPKHPRHEEALDYFGKSGNAVVLRWILIEKYKLTPKEAIRFLGGRETDRFRRVLILYLEKDKGPMREAVVDFLENTPNTGATRVVASWVEGKLLEAHPQIEETDLRVSGAKSIREAVLEKLGKH